MYIMSVTTLFSAAHHLRGYAGDCSRMHGHSWKVTAKVRASLLDDIGLAYDFREMKTKLNEIVKQFDHQLLNDIPPFDVLNPSSENLAKFFYDSLKQSIPPEVTLMSVEIKESDSCAVIYIED